MALAYKVVGDGPSVVLISGLGGTSRFWDPAAQVLARQFTVVSFDHPGIGDSASTGRPSISEIASAALDVASEAGFEQFGIVGHSTGGLVAQALALDVPERIQSLVLSCTWATPDARFRRLFELRKLVLKSAGVDAYQALGDVLTYPQDFYEQHCNSGGASAARQTPGDDVFISGTAERIDMLLSYSRFEELPRLRVPTLVIGALDDWIVPVIHSRQLVRAITGAEIAEMLGGHFLPRTQTGAYAHKVMAFLERAKYVEN